MSIDHYAPCPCGSGKKLKFCCADLAGDIEKIHHQIASDQPRAALRRIEQLLAKHRNRASLMDLKASVQLALHDFDGAATTIKGFLDAHPDTPVSHAQTAILLAAKEHPIEAIAKVQDALERIEHDMPLRVLEAIGAVGHALLLSGDFVAARAHLMLYADIAPEDDNAALEMLLRLNLQSGLPLTLCEQPPLLEAPDEAPWKAAFDEASRTAGRGLWRRAEAQFSELTDESNDDQRPDVVYNLALLRGWLGDDARLAEGMHRFAELDVSRRAAEEAEALAQLIDPQLERYSVESVCTTYAISDDDLLLERFAKDPRVESYDQAPESLEKQEGPPPRETYILLDRPALKSSDGLTWESAPVVLAFMSVYGKRTDCEARLTVTAERDDLFENVERTIREIAGAAIGSEQKCETVGETALAASVLRWRWRLPDDTPASMRRELIRQRRHRAILENWVAAPQAALLGKSPGEAANDPGQQIRLGAAVLLLEQSALDSLDNEVIAELREQLGLPATERIDPTLVDLNRLSIARVSQLDFARLDDAQLAELQSRTTWCGANVAAKAVAEELVVRTSEPEQKRWAYRQLIRGEPKPDRANELLLQAKQWAASQGDPIGEWIVLELEHRLLHGDADGVQESLNQIREEHLDEPGVGEDVFRLLHRAGFVAPQSVAPGHQPEALPAAAPPAAENRLWTPDSDEPVREGGGKSALWTP